MDVIGALYHAARGGNLAEVDRLLSDARVDPAADNNGAIRLAASCIHSEDSLAMVNRLLDDHRVNPAADDNNAIRMAAQSGRLDVVERLLLEPAVVACLLPEHVVRDAAVYRRVLPARVVAALADRSWARRRAAVLAWKLRQPVEEEE